MKKEFVTYNQALKLKALGFDEPCLAFYQIEYAEVIPTMVDDNEEYRLTGFRTCKNSKIPEHYTSAPTFSQAFRWFREKFNIYAIILPSYADDKVVKDRFFYEIANGRKLNQELNYHNTYEEAELACLDKLIEMTHPNK